MGRWAQRRRSGTDTSRASQARVVSVTKQSGNTLLWTFSVQVVSDGTASPQLSDTTLSSSANPIATGQSGLYAVICTYSATPAVGHTYNMGTTPTHLTNPNGSGFVVPQTGTVT